MDAALQGGGRETAAERGLRGLCSVAALRSRKNLLQDQHDLRIQRAPVSPGRRLDALTERRGHTKPERRLVSNAVVVHHFSTQGDAVLTTLCLYSCTL